MLLNKISHHFITRYAGRDWRQEEKGMTENEMAGWHHRLNGCEFEWTPGVDDGQGGLECCDSWGRKELDTTEQLNWTDRLKYSFLMMYYFKSSRKFSNVNKIEYC